jgi:uncharacterized SAM-binding protein YcdF (DUF218 family)
MIRRRRGRVLAAGALILAVSLWAGRGWVLRPIGRFLVVEDALIHTHAAVVFGGHVPFRAMEAGRLFQQGWVDEVWLTQGAVFSDDRALEAYGISRPKEYEYSRAVLERMGVPPACIRVLPGHNANTAEEVQSVARAARDAGRGPVLVVTSKYHARRVRVIWKALVGDAQPVLIRYTRDDPFDPDTWWRATGTSKRVLYEWLGLMNAWAGFPIRPATDE